MDFFVLFMFLPLHLQVIGLSWEGSQGQFSHGRERQPVGEYYTFSEKYYKQHNFSKGSGNIALCSNFPHCGAEQLHWCRALFNNMSEIKKHNMRSFCHHKLCCSRFWVTWSLLPLTRPLKGFCIPQVVTFGEFKLASVTEVKLRGFY